MNRQNTPTDPGDATSCLWIHAYMTTGNYAVELSTGTVLCFSAVLPAGDGEFLRLINAKPINTPAAAIPTLPKEVQVRKSNIVWVAEYGPGDGSQPSSAARESQG